MDTNEKNTIHEDGRDLAIAVSQPLTVSEAVPRRAPSPDAGRRLSSLWIMKTLSRMVHTSRFVNVMFQCNPTAAVVLPQIKTKETPTMAKSKPPIGNSCSSTKSNLGGNIELQARGAAGIQITIDELQIAPST